MFPLLPNSKLPAYGESWYDVSTTDEATIRAMWTDPVTKEERDWNIGTDCTGRVVVDIDVKDGKDGYNQYMQLGGTLDTLVVQTPTGGFHAYFEGEDVGNVNIASDIEIRSHHGYVVAPGSTIDGAYYRVIDDREPAYVPLNVSRLLTDAKERSTTERFEGEEDTETAVAAAINYLRSAPPAIEGQRGDETTFITAARLVRELALSPYKTWELMAEHWNPRCLPPWPLDELMGKVENAASYGTADLGGLDPATLFKAVLGLSLAPPPSVFEQASLDWGNALLPTDTKPRPWLVDRMLMLSTVSMLLAPGSAGKSSVGLALAAHVCMGVDFGGHKVHQAGKVVVYNGEDDVEEQSRRLQAVCTLYGFDYNTVRSRVMLLDGDTLDARVAGRGGGGIVIENEIFINQITGLLSDPEVVLAIFDPFVDMHSVDEGDSGAMNIVMKILKRIAKTTNVAVLAMHHTVKAGNSKQEDRIGNMDISRGSSGIVFKARIAMTLLNASDKDVEDYGIADGERHMWARLDDAKMNLALANTTPMWFKREGIKIASGDVVGVLRATELRKNVQHMRVRIAEILADHFMANNTATLPIMAACAICKHNEPLWESRSDRDIKQNLEGYFATPLTINGGTIRIDRSDEKKVVIVWG